MQEKIPVWIDCDPGVDDAFAILFAAYHPNIHLIGISTVYGDVPLENTTYNALSILEILGMRDIPVVAGASQRFCGSYDYTAMGRGQYGLPGTELLPEPVKSALDVNAIEYMRKSLLACPAKTAWLVATGPLTNIALLFAVYPEVAGHIKGLSIVGGTIGDGFGPGSLMSPFYTDKDGHVWKRGGYKTRFAEFNISNDPGSAHSVLGNPILRPKTVLSPLDVTYQLLAKPRFLEALLQGTHGPTRLRRMYNEILTFYCQNYAIESANEKIAPLHAPVGVAAIFAHHEDEQVRIRFDDSFYEEWKIDVDLKDEYGQTVIKPAKDGLVVPRSLVDREKVFEILKVCIARADEATLYKQ